MPTSFRTVASPTLPWHCKKDCQMPNIHITGLTRHHSKIYKWCFDRLCLKVSCIIASHADRWVLVIAIHTNKYILHLTMHSRSGVIWICVCVLHKNEKSLWIEQLGPPLFQPFDCVSLFYTWYFFLFNFFSVYWTPENQILKWNVMIPPFENLAIVEQYLNK